MCKQGYSLQGASQWKCNEAGIWLDAHTSSQAFIPSCVLGIYITKQFFINFFISKVLIIQFICFFNWFNIHKLINIVPLYFLLNNFNILFAKDVSSKTIV